MALHCFDYPGSKSYEDYALREKIFNIIAHCVMSQADIDVVMQSPLTVRQLWLESFSMTQKGMLATKLQTIVKDDVQRFANTFPPEEAFQFLLMQLQWGLLRPRLFWTGDCHICFRLFHGSD